jgi:hypothetical protein
MLLVAFRTRKTHQSEIDNTLTRLVFIAVPNRTQSLIPSISIPRTPPAFVSATQLLAGVAMLVSVPVLLPTKSVSVVVPFPAVSFDGHQQAIGVFPFTEGSNVAGVKL